MVFSLRGNFCLKPLQSIIIPAPERIGKNAKYIANQQTEKAAPTLPEGENVDISENELEGPEEKIKSA